MTNYILRFLDTSNIKKYTEKGGYEGLKKAIKMSPKEVIQEIKSSGLRGRGGAGFPTGIKWESLSNEKPAYIVCNADEGEPGTFKDRLLLESAPHLVIEGLIIAGYANQAEKGYIYI